jgi:hypothetical protein
MKNTIEEYFPDFIYPASGLAKFIAAGDIFTIMLKGGAIVHYTAKNKELFKQWLLDHRVCDLKAN